MKDSNQHQASRWLSQAQSDLAAARWNAQGQFWANACFFSQQASEKALKAFCYAQGEREVIGHSLLVLSRKCSKYDEAFHTIAGECRRLDKYYITARYPNGLPDATPAEYFDQEEAQAAIGYAETIVGMVATKLASLHHGGDTHDSTAT